MSRLIGVSLAVGCALVLAAGAASAQTPYPGLYNRPNYGPGYRPMLSPYLNLANNNDPAINYFLRTVPDLNQRATNRLYGAAIGGLEERALNPIPPQPADVDLFTPQATTGHPVAFQNTGGYFPSGPARPAVGAAYQPPPRPR